MSGEETHLWVMVSNMDQDAKADEIPTIISRITSLVDDWHSKGRIMLSGPFDNKTSSMTVVAASTKEAEELFQQWKDICSGFLVSEMYRWDAMPILSVMARQDLH